MSWVFVFLGHAQMDSTTFVGLGQVLDLALFEKFIQLPTSKKRERLDDGTPFASLLQLLLMGYERFMINSDQTTALSLMHKVTPKSELW